MKKEGFGVKLDGFAEWRNTLVDRAMNAAGRGEWEDVLELRSRLQSKDWDFYTQSAAATHGGNSRPATARQRACTWQGVPRRAPWSVFAGHAWNMPYLETSLHLNLDVMV